MFEEEPTTTASTTPFTNPTREDTGKRIQDHRRNPDGPYYTPITQEGTNNDTTPEILRLRPLARNKPHTIEPTESTDKRKREEEEIEQNTDNPNSGPAKTR